jgi:TfoX/Sxy family transcriptional regulator of competence genes
MDSFKEFILDQLSGLNAICCKKMFRRYGIYYQEFFLQLSAMIGFISKPIQYPLRNLKVMEWNHFNLTPQTKIKKLLQSSRVNTRR